MLNDYFAFLFLIKQSLDEKSTKFDLKKRAIFRNMTLPRENKNNHRNETKYGQWFYRISKTEHQTSNL